MNRGPDWMRQGKRDLSHAKNALKDGDYEWACFAAQQSAEQSGHSFWLHVEQNHTILFEKGR